jgi:hypothetical protein
MRLQLTKHVLGLGGKKGPKFIKMHFCPISIDNAKKKLALPVLKISSVPSKMIYAKLHERTVIF